jgi:methylamine---glutamate N-methyltransferase subunit B
VNRPTPDHLSAMRNSVLDLRTASVRQINHLLHAAKSGDFTIKNPRGAHALAAGLNSALAVHIEGHVGYYCAGMNKHAKVTIDGNAGTGVAENMMSGRVHVKGDASQSAGASGCGGLLVIDGNASARCGISLRGLNIVVRGSVGHLAGFMAQTGMLVVLGDAGEALGDSIYEARIFVCGETRTLGADCIAKPLRDEHRAALRALLEEAGVGGEIDVSAFKRYGSARQLYHFHIANLGSY